jgi:hypothetical protein
MEELFESLELNEETKTKLAEAFDKAVMAKTVELLDEHVEVKLKEERELLEEEYQEKVEALENTLDGYLQSVVEEFVEENKPVYEAQIQEEKVKTLLEMFDSMLKVAGVTMVDINEAHEEYHEENDIENRLARLEEKLNQKQEELQEARKEADQYLKSGVILEMKEGLTLLEAEKFEKLAEMVTFTRDESYVNALETIKESIVDSREENEKIEESFGKLPEGTFKETKLDPKKVMDISKYV